MYEDLNDHMGDVTDMMDEIRIDPPEKEEHSCWTFHFPIGVSCSSFKNKLWLCVGDQSLHIVSCPFCGFTLEEE